MTLSPNHPQLVNADGSLNWAPTQSGTSTIVLHPLAILTSKYLNKTSNLIGSALLSYKITDGIQLKANVGYNRLYSEEIRTSTNASIAPEYRMNSHLEC
jgi:hypothetical protein